MKQLFFAFVIIGIIIPLTGRSQKNSANLMAEIAVCSSKSTGVAMPADAVNPRAKRLFEKEFKNPPNAQWLQLKDGLLAGFSENDTKYSVYYYNNGYKAGLIKGYAAGKLQPAVKEIVENDYAGYSITYVQEATAVSTNDTPVYIINLQGVNDIKVIRICEGETDVVFDSSKPLSIERF